jgi:hypothetical protein
MRRIAALLLVFIICGMPLAAYAAETESPPAETQNSPLVADQLYIDSARRYEGMDKTYAQGYMPTIKDGVATIILPLVGETLNATVHLKADLGSATNSPFVYGNYSQTVSGDGLYVFSLTIPLTNGRINGSYPVVLTAEYLDVMGMKATQTFTVYVTVTDGQNPVDPNARPEKETVEKPELFISSCVINPNSVGGGEEFTVEVNVENIGSLRAQSVRLTYSGVDSGGVIPLAPLDSNNSTHLENMGAGEHQSLSFKLKADADALAGNQPFTITLDYLDAYGGIYGSSRQFFVLVTQPAKMSYDPISPPKTVEAGKTMTLPANVFNMGKSTLRNVTIAVQGVGLFPASSVFLGDILPGQSGNGEIIVFVGMLSMTEGYTESYGRTNGVYSITYYDDAGEEHLTEVKFSLDITEPVIEGEEDATEMTQQPVFQWWVAVLVSFALIAIVVAFIVLSKTLRTLKMK